VGTEENERPRTNTLIQSCLRSEKKKRRTTRNRNWEEMKGQEKVNKRCLRYVWKEKGTRGSALRGGKGRAMPIESLKAGRGRIREERGSIRRLTPRPSDAAKKERRTDSMDSSSRTRKVKEGARKGWGSTTRTLEKKKLRAEAG